MPSRGEKLTADMHPDGGGGVFKGVYVNFANIAYNFGQQIRARSDPPATEPMVAGVGVEGGGIGDGVSKVGNRCALPRALRAAKGLHESVLGEAGPDGGFERAPEKMNGAAAMLDQAGEATKKGHGLRPQKIAATEVEGDIGAFAVPAPEIEEPGAVARVGAEGWDVAEFHAKAKGVEALFIDFSIQDKDSGLNLIIGFKINKQRLDPFGLNAKGCGLRRGRIGLLDHVQRVFRLVGTVGAGEALDGELPPELAKLGFIASCFGQ